jgi:hypothetical protein
VRKSLENALRLAEKLDMDAVTYILVGAPGQDPMESVDDLLYLANQNTLAGVSVFYPAPGSAMWHQPTSAGTVPDDFSLMRSSAIPVSDLTTRLDSLTLLRLGRILNFTRELLKRGHRILAEPLTTRLDIPENRFETGRILLEKFYSDGTILGIDSKGNPFRHDVSESLCEKFRLGMMEKLRLSNVIGSERYLYC